MRQILLTLALCTIGSPLMALCGGESYFDRLTLAQTAQLETEVAGIPYANGTTWTATREAVQMTLVGTMHIHDNRLDKLRAKLRRTVQSADLILLEATPAEEAKVQAAITQNPDLIFIENGPTLPEILDEATWQQVIDAVRAIGIPPFLAAKFEPWYLMMTLAIPTCAMQDLAAGKRGLDHMIMEDGIAADVPLQALEPFDTLFTIFQNEDMDAQIEMLKLSLMNNTDQQAMFVAMLDSYFAQDIGKLVALSRIIAETIPSLDPAEARAMALETEETVIGDRNRAWMSVINAAAAQHTNIVIAVGAAHLPDNAGLLSLLENDGWTISPF